VLIPEGTLITAILLPEQPLVNNAMSYACTNCDAEFESAAGVTQHVALHHNRCGVCNEGFDDEGGLRDHVHAEH
jgi:DNA-directed RNA polymerase subunit RPC12/RpoP